MLSPSAAAPPNVLGGRLDEYGSMLSTDEIYHAYATTTDQDAPHHQPTSSDHNSDDKVTAHCQNAAATNFSSKDRIIDPKRVQRILANRQSARRSRVRKLQYITELERSVTSLQAEVSMLSPRVAFLDQQRLLLNVDNTALKQRIATLSQDKIFKDAHEEALKREIERLGQLYHRQQIKAKEPTSPTDQNQNKKLLYV